MSVIGRHMIVYTIMKTTTMLIVVDHSISSLAIGYWPFIIFELFHFQLEKLVIERWFRIKWLIFICIVNCFILFYALR